MGQGKTSQKEASRKTEPPDPQMGPRPLKLKTQEVLCDLCCLPPTIFVDPGLRQATAVSKPFSDYRGGWVQCQARDTYLCTDCYVWDDAVERKRDMSTARPVQLREAGGVSHPLSLNLKEGHYCPWRPSPLSRRTKTLSFNALRGPVFTKHTSDLGQ